MIDVKEPRPGRNDRCWCGSGRKYKTCHLTEDLANQRDQKERARAEAEEERGGHGERMCARYSPQTHKVAAVERPDFVIAVRNLSSGGPGAWLHIESPVDLGRDQGSVDLALDFLRKYGVTPDFAHDPSPEVIESVQDVLDRLSGRGVFQVQPSGARLRRYRRTEVTKQQRGGAYLAYLSGRGSLHGVVQLLLEAAVIDAAQLGIAGGLLAEVWPVARVAREIVRNKLSLTEPLQRRSNALVATLIDQISQGADRLAEAGATSDVVRAYATLPYLVGLKEALSDPASQLEGMGLDDETVRMLQVQLELAVGSPPWLLQLASSAGDDWDTQSGYQAWLESARSFTEVVDAQLALVPSSASGADQAAEGAALSRLPAPRDPTAPSDDAAAIPSVAAVAESSDPLRTSPTLTLFSDLDTGLHEHAVRREGLRDHLAGILDRREKLNAERRDLQARLASVDAEGDAVDVEQEAATRELDLEAEAEADYRRVAVRAVIAAGASRLGEAIEPAQGQDPTGDSPDGSTPLATAERLVREFEEMERRGLLGQLPPGVRANIEMEVVAARAAMREALGGRDPLRLPAVVSASDEEETLTLSVGIPIARDDELAPGTLRMAVASAIAEALSDVAHSVPQIDVEAIEHFGWEEGGSVIRMRFSGAPPVTADDCAQYCASLLRDVSDRSPTLRSAGVSIEARVESDLEGND